MKKFLCTIFVSLFLFGLDAEAQTKKIGFKKLVLSPLTCAVTRATIGSELSLYCDARDDNYRAIDSSTPVIAEEIANPSTQAIAACKLSRDNMIVGGKWNVLTLTAPRTTRPYGLRTLHAATRRVTRRIVKALPMDFEFVDKTGLFTEGDSIFARKT